MCHTFYINQRQKKIQKTVPDIDKTVSEIDKTVPKKTQKKAPCGARKCQPGGVDIPYFKLSQIL